MKQLRQLLNIHLRSAKDSENTLLSKQKITRDSRSSVHEAFHEERSRESRLKSNTSQLLALVLKLKSFTSKTVLGNNVVFSLDKEFEKDYSTMWEFSIIQTNGKILVKEIVNSQKLTFIGREIQGFYKKNTVILEFNDGFYSLEKEKQVFYSSPTLIKKSYSLSQFKSIKTREEAVKDVKLQISQILQQGKVALKSKKENTREIKSRIREIEAMIIESSHQILGIKGKIYRIKNVLKGKLEKIQDSRLQGMNYVKNTLKTRSQLLNSRNYLGKVLVESRQRQVQLALELKYVFKIDESRNSINGLDLGVESDEKMSSGYGLVCLLVSVLFGILDLRPRYPLLIKGSRCCIIDYISLKSFPIYPLYLKGMDRSRFEYGVFLLNKDIQQLLNYLGISLKRHQLRNTIQNIGLVWKVLEKGPSIPVIVEDSETMRRSLVVMDKRSISPLKTEAWSGIQNEEGVFRID